jgi:hypothetical protein
VLTRGQRLPDDAQPFLDDLRIRPDFLYRTTPSRSSSMARTTISPARRPRIAMTPTIASRPPAGA